MFKKTSHISKEIRKVEMKRQRQVGWIIRMKSEGGK
jgi:ribosomal protein L34